MSRFIDAKFIAADLDVSEATAYRYMREMSPHEIGGRLRVSPSNYEAWIRAHTFSPHGQPVTDEEWAEISRGLAETGPFVYFIRCGRFVKVGWTKNHPRLRLGRLQIGSPLRMELIGFVRGGEALERTLHARLRPWRERGEWFRDVARVRQHIAATLSEDT